jgi:hypothetical protein
LRTRRAIIAGDFADLGLAALTSGFFGGTVAAQSPQDYWEKDIAAFEAADRATPPPKGEVVFVGSSTIRLWDLAASFPDVKAINRGFGGSEMADATRYVGRIVVPYAPRTVVVYSGDNDIMGTTAEQITIAFERFVRAVHAVLPTTRIVIIGIKPSLLRWAQDLEEFTKLGVDKVIKEARRVAGKGPAYVSFDVDGLDPVYAPGTGTPEIGGMTTLEAHM